MKNIKRIFTIITLQMLIIVAMYAQPILPQVTYKLIDRYEPTVTYKFGSGNNSVKYTKPIKNKKPTKETTPLSTLKAVPLKTSVSNETNKQDSINKEILSLLKLYGQELVDLKKTVKNTEVPTSIMCEHKNDLVKPLPVLDTLALRKEKRQGIYFIVGGVLTQTAGTIYFVKNYKPTEIKNVVRVTPKGVIMKSEVNNHTKDNIKNGVILGSSLILGTVLEVVGVSKLNNVHVTANGVKIDLFAKKYKHRK